MLHRPRNDEVRRALCSARHQPQEKGAADKSWASILHLSDDTVLSRLNVHRRNLGNGTSDEIDIGPVQTLEET